jgi:inner membrane transporter RhtA
MKSVAAPIATLIAAIICFQVGATVAKGLFPVVGAAGTTALRTGFASLMLVIVWRPWRMRFGWAEARTIGIYGLSLAWMNLLFYSSLETIPLGIAVAIEFIGPLAVAFADSRRPIDYVWILLAVVGLLALLPLGRGATPLSLVGIAYALGAGVCWALYIIYGRRAGAAHGGQTTALGMLMAALIVVPIGLHGNGMKLFSPSILPVALIVALISSALPYSLEMIAMPKIQPRTLGVLMSLDPAFGAVAGLLFLSEHLTYLQWAAVGSIVVASAGSAFSHQNAAEPKRLPD